MSIASVFAPAVFRPAGGELANWKHGNWRLRCRYSETACVCAAAPYGEPLRLQTGCRVPVLVRGALPCQASRLGAGRSSEKFATGIRKTNEARPRPACLRADQAIPVLPGAFAASAPPLEMCRTLPSRRLCAEPAVQYRQANGLCCPLPDRPGHRRHAVQSVRGTRSKPISDRTIARNSGADAAPVGPSFRPCGHLPSGQWT